MCSSAARKLGRQRETLVQIITEQRSTTLQPFALQGGVLPCVVLQCCVLRQVADVLCQMQLHDAQQLVQRLGELMLLQSRAWPASAACCNTAHRAQAGPVGLSYARQGLGLLTLS